MQLLMLGCSFLRRAEESKGLYLLMQFALASLNLNMWEKQGVMDRWGPTAFLPIVQLLGSDWVKSSYAALFSRDDFSHDTFVKADFAYQEAVASFIVGSAVKAEGELVIAGTEGYIYVPSSWWKTDYFEVRFENQTDNKRYFYQLEGEGIRYEIAAFIRAINSVVNVSSIEEDVSIKIADAFDKYRKGENLVRIG